MSDDPQLTHASLLLPTQHPGGDEVLFGEVGRDATEAFEDVGHSDEAREILAKYYVGEGPEVSVVLVPFATILQFFAAAGCRIVSCGVAWLDPVPTATEATSPSDILSRRNMPMQLNELHRDQELTLYLSCNAGNCQGSCTGKEPAGRGWCLQGVVRLASDPFCLYVPFLTPLEADYFFHPCSSGGFGYLLPLAGLAAYFAYRRVSNSISAFTDSCSWTDEISNRCRYYATKE